MTEELTQNGINTFYDNDFLNSPIFKAPNNTNINEESPILAKTKLHAEIFNAVKFTDRRDEIIESSEKSMSICDDLALFRYNFDEVELPKVELQKETPLSIREEGSIPVMSLIELIGAVQNVKITRMYNKQNDDIQKRNIIWDEVKKYSLREDVSKTLFSKSVIKQFLLLHMLPIGNNGSLFDVPYKLIADYLGVSIRTVQNNNKKLEEFGFISLDKERVKHFNYTLLHYAFKADEGRGGYIKIARRGFEEFMSIKDVNVLRLGLRMYMRFIKEMENKKRASNEAPTYTIDEIKSFLPSYKTNPLSIQNLLDELKNLFNNLFVENVIAFSFNDELRPETEQTKVYDAVNKTVIALLKNGVKLFDKKDKNDLLQLANQYGLNKTIQAVEIMINDEKMMDSLNSGRYPFGMMLRSLLNHDTCYTNNFPMFVH